MVPRRLTKSLVGSRNLGENALDISFWIWELPLFAARPDLRLFFRCPLHPFRPVPKL